MAQFSFDYNIGDILRFKYVSGESTCALRGTVSSILIMEDKYLYAISTINGQLIVSPEDVIEPIYSTKSFEVFYPGVNVIVNVLGQHFAGTIDSAVIRAGHLCYWVRTSEDTMAQYDECCVFLLTEKNIQLLDWRETDQGGGC